MTALCAALVQWGADAGLAAQQGGGPPPQQSAADAPSRLSGIWTLNKDLSTDTSGIGQQAPPQTNGGGTAGRSGGRSGGRRGGFGGGGGGGRTGPSQDQMAQMRALWREITDTPQQVTIVATASEVNFTDDQGTVRKYTANDKKESIDLATAKIDATTWWDDNVLKQDMAGGPLKASWTYQVTVEGHQLIVTITTTQSGGGQAQSTPIKRVYDRAG